MIKQIFNDKEIRFIEKEDEYWAVAGDVAKVLGYSHTPHMTRLLDESEKAVHNVVTVKGKQNAVIILEIGIYEAIWNSRRDEAQEF
ncbi:prophage antirepressor-like protein [Staphylococcus epidermidis]|jgi:putative prophage antirepressor|uniref:BRO-N domain-containing protein n=1 Tax=Staphylococcus epidermidis TaxID=1282 RepID=UPI0002F4D6E3|nr:Bro-N domain-containing protein [Staphylococcus epidermidis]DAN64625.1 MAG TPA: BRO family protein [Caudoviricetes sp.]